LAEEKKDSAVPGIACLSTIIGFFRSLSALSQLDGNIIHCAFLSPSSVWLAIFKTPNYADISVSLPSDSHRAALVLAETDSPRLGFTAVLCWLGQIGSRAPTQSGTLAHLPLWQVVKHVTHRKVRDLHAKAAATHRAQTHPKALGRWSPMYPL
jgi:hypothetical protein